MFAIDDQIISFRFIGSPKEGKLDDPVAQELWDGMQATRSKYKRNLTIEYPDRWKKQDDVRKKKPGVSLNMVAKGVPMRDHMAHTVRYFEELKNDENGNPVYTIGNGKTRYDFTGYKQFDLAKPRDLEMAYFLVKFSKEQADDKNPGGYFKVRDVEVQESEKALYQRTLGLCSVEVYKQRPLEELKAIAKAWDVISVEEMSEVMIQNSLWDKVKRTPNGIDDFLRSPNFNAEYELKAYARDGAERKILGYDPTGENKVWHFISIDPQTNRTNYERRLFTQNKSQNDLQALSSYFYDHPEDYVYLKREVDKSIKIEKKQRNQDEEINVEQRIEKQQEVLNSMEFQQEQQEYDKALADTQEVMPEIAIAKKEQSQTKKAKVHTGGRKRR
jgi:hypothetical protein